MKEKKRDMRYEYEDPTDGKKQTKAVELVAWQRPRWKTIGRL